jgi:hypothetical protein
MPSRRGPPRDSLLAALGPGSLRPIEKRLETVALSRGTVLHEPDAPVAHAYFPRDCVVSLTAPVRGR